MKTIFDDHCFDWCEVVLIVVVICISLIICGVGGLFMCLLVICISSLEKRLFRSSYFLKGFCCCCYWTAWTICIFWRWIPCQLVALLQIFSYSVGCLFIVFISSIAVQKLLSIIRSHWFIFVSFSLL